MAIYKEGKSVEPYKKGGDGTKNHRKWQKTVLNHNLPTTTITLNYTTHITSSTTQYTPSLSKQWEAKLKP